MKLFIFLSCIIFCSFSTVAAPQYAGTVKGFYINNGKTVLVKLDTPTPACGDQTWPFQFSLSGEVAKGWMSMLLMARASEAQIGVGYAPNENGRCNVEYFYFYN
ncbi:hypothetical protein [Shewanella woodyi]|uniref:Uncharacterized protein n=1 Tax=Shewanella woodyi (strain ATCC 51908 / MS32) TaxID=392500 RepID=B1KKC3_SHEWM|nr:hypothetical protein [Shewanella woodyi]ACA85763.1 hypothetical protein Swoo_1475 [Shewanella woodyi ATCC 51908]